jgi:prephenate dehydrogenase
MLRGFFLQHLKIDIIMHVTMIGLGLIGGSMAIDLKRRGFATRITGVDKDELHAAAAIKLGIVDETASLHEAVRSSDLVVLATPVDVTLELLPKVMDSIGDQLVTDVCSTKAGICDRISNHPKRAHYVAGHPMAGTEKSGPWAALKGLFDGKAVIFTDVEKSSKEALSTVYALYETLNMRPLVMDSKDHDTHAAYVSHISHISSYALALTVLDKEKNEKNIFDLASGGFDSTVRLAKSGHEMWTPIFVHNASNVLTVLDTYIDKLQSFRDAISAKDQKEITQLIEQANKIKKVI